MSYCITPHVLLEQLVVTRGYLLVLKLLWLLEVTRGYKRLQEVTHIYVVVLEVIKLYLGLETI